MAINRKNLCFTKKKSLVGLTLGFFSTQRRWERESGWLGILSKLLDCSKEVDCQASSTKCFIDLGKLN